MLSHIIESRVLGRSVDSHLPLTRDRVAVELLCEKYSTDRKESHHDDDDADNHRRCCLPNMAVGVVVLHQNRESRSVVLLRRSILLAALRVDRNRGKLALETRSLNNAVVGGKICFVCCEYKRERRTHEPSNVKVRFVPWNSAQPLT